jgi:hypothetical protein
MCPSNFDQKFFMKNICIILALSFLTATASWAQNVGINTTTPQATLDVKGGQRVGGSNHYTSYDSVSGNIVWNNSNLFVSSPQYLMRHSATGEGLYYGNSRLEYRSSFGTPVFYTNSVTGNGYFYGNLGIGIEPPLGFPLSFRGDLGNKISLWDDGSGTSYGFGIQSLLLQIHTDVQQADIGFGYGSSGSFTENFRFRGNGAFAVQGSSGAPGQVLMSNGQYAAAYWGYTTPTFQFFSQTGNAMNLSSNLATIPGINGQRFTTKYNSKLMITVSAEIQIDAGEPEQSILISTDIKNSSNAIIGSSSDYVLMKPTKSHAVKRNATATIFIGDTGKLAPGTYSIACSVQRINDANTGKSRCTKTQVIVQAIPQ